MSQVTPEEDWRWPKHGQTDVDPQDSISKIVDLYRSSNPPVCYPGSHLDFDPEMESLILAVLRNNPNLIGTHTHFITVDGVRIPKRGEGGFELTQQLEASIIWMIGGMVGGTRETIDGLFCGGGTEANLQGMYIGRNWLRNNCPDPNKKGVVVLTTPLVHYSVIKNADILSMGDGKFERCMACGNLHRFKSDPSGTGVTFVGMNDSFEMDMNDLDRVYKEKYAQGFRRFMIVPAVGTTDMGSIDPIADISRFIDNVHASSHARFYMHVDASFGGFTVPFVNPDTHIGFENRNVMSMTLDGDKMGQLPYPAGVFLCRKGLTDNIAREVNYVEGNQDDSVSGSRTALPAAIAWYQFRKYGTEGQRQYVQACLDTRNALVHKLRFELGDDVTIMPYSPWINLLPIRIRAADTFMKNHLTEGGLLAPFQMRKDFVPHDTHDVMSCPYTVYKLCIMPHLLRTGILDTFVETLKQALRS